MVIKMMKDYPAVTSHAVAIGVARFMVGVFDGPSERQQRFERIPDGVAVSFTLVLAQPYQKIFNLINYF